MTIQELLQDKIAVLDGAMGTMIQKHGLREEDYRGDRFKDWSSSLKGNNDLLSLTQPEIIRDIHLEYLEAGADIIETNTFSANKISMADYHMEDLVYELNYESAKLAKEAITLYHQKYGYKPLFVAGSIGPTNKTASLSPDVNNPQFREVSFDDLAGIYKEQVMGLIDGGADLILIETIFDTLNAKAALWGVEEAFREKNVELPIMVSGTITDASGRTLSGQTPEAFLNSISHLPLLSVGLNCALGAKALTPHIKVMAENSPFLVSVYPNAGLPNELGGYDQSPEEMASQIEDFLKNNWINIVGGCCGTTPDHIKAIAEKAKQYKRKKLTLEIN